MPGTFRFRALVAPVGVGLIALACGGGGEGGGGVTGSATVTPLNGAWTDSAQPGEFLQFVDPGPAVSLFSPKLDIKSATLENSTELCGGERNLQGTLDNGKLTLYVGTQRQSPCMVGTFTDQRALEASSPNGAVVRHYRNNRVDVGLACGLWVSDGAQVKLKFVAPQSVDNGASVPVTGSDVSAGAPGVPFSGNMTGFAAGAPPKMALLTNDATSAALFRDLVFVDGARIEGRDAAGQALKLQRQADPADASCNF